jgi:hypothetical protein
MAGNLLFGDRTQGDKAKTNKNRHHYMTPVQIFISKKFNLRLRARSHEPNSDLF